MTETFVDVRMRDGVEVRTRVNKPREEGCWPVVFSKGYQTAGDPGFVEHDYVWVSQEPKEGTTRFFDDGEDGYDTVEWIAEQDWCNGKVVMYGRSYWSMTQWLTARLHPPHLVAIVPQHMNTNVYELVYRNHGALNLAMTAPSRGIVDREAGERFGWEAALMHLPLITMDEVVGGKENELWRDYVSHATYDDYWKAISLTDEEIGGIDIPVFNQSGWFDYYAGAAFRHHKLLKGDSGKDQRLSVGAVNHGGRRVGDRPGLEAGVSDQLGDAIRWLDWVVKGRDTGMRDELPVRIFTMGINEWQAVADWPLPDTVDTSFYLSSSNGSRVGSLVTEVPGEEVPSQYVYDPDDPVRSLGGNHSADGRPWHLKAIEGVNLHAGSFDQRANEGRQDVLLFETEPLAEAVEVTGDVSAVLFAETDGLDTDWIVRLLDVHPDGASYHLTEGIIRARFRKSIYEAPELLSPGEIYEYAITLMPTSNVFLKGHRIRVHVTSSNWPLIDRNPNTGAEQGMDAEVRVARQKVYHDGAHPSHVILPIIPR